MLISGEDCVDLVTVQALLTVASLTSEEAMVKKSGDISQSNKGAKLEKNEANRLSCYF